MRSRSAWVAPRSVGLDARPDVRVEGFAITPEQLIGSGATVAAVVRYTGTGKATGKPLDVPVVHVWDIRDGKLARFRQFIDTVKFAEVVPAGVAAA